jgi:RNA polymerase sigma-70 factor, ECF subfamily
MHALLKLFRRPASLALDHFESTLQAHAGQWFSACLRITKDASLAEDAVQDALLKAWDRRTQFRAQAELASWIYKIAVNSALDLLRRRGGSHAFTSTALGADAAHQPAIDLFCLGKTSNTGLDPFDYGAQQQWQDDVALALHELTDLERVCFVLKHIESYSLDEISSKLESSTNSVKQALFRASKKMRHALSNWQGTAA